MLIFNFVMGLTGLILAGDSFGRCVREKTLCFIVAGIIELTTGIYFLIAAIGNCST